MKTQSLRPHSKSERTARFYRRMDALGFTFAETETLRLAQLTLTRWAERECNGEVERDEATGKTYSRHTYGVNDTRRSIPDRETGALRRVKETVDTRNAREAAAKVQGHGSGLPPVTAYHQTDPRGCALYLVPADVIPEGGDIGSYYSRGLAVCI